MSTSSRAQRRTGKESFGNCCWYDLRHSSVSMAAPPEVTDGSLQSVCDCVSPNWMSPRMMNPKTIGRCSHLKQGQARHLRAEKSTQIASIEQLTSKLLIRFTTCYFSCIGPLDYASASTHWRVAPSSRLKVPVKAGVWRSRVCVVRVMLSAGMLPLSSKNQAGLMNTCA
jgi:hypothetical protein